MDTADTKSLDKKRLIVFIAVAYCVSFLMMIPMYIGKKNGVKPGGIVQRHHLIAQLRQGLPRRCD